ncbi:MAG: DUF5107 domain-containing protein [Bryobacteraceae bacterium]|nr:DUF5107 domain-containing protein [Bryobacteraceae bacterium]
MTYPQKASAHACIAAVLFALPAFAAQPVTVQVKDETIPTYLAGPPEMNPMFYFGKASQGAEGRVYPYPLYDSLTNNKVDKQYKVVWLENEYVRIGIMPEIGGRLFEGYDKTNGYHFFYRQHVIKPALIGLIGAWISGGIEWNIPHHHRASTFLPVQYSVEDGPGGSKTVWVGELEVRSRTRWAVGYTLYPGKAYMEAKIRIANRTPVSNSMLCFANVAVHVNDDYQVIFPPSTQYGTHHSKREFIQWPMANGRYGGGDFSKGVDVSWYKNHESANSIFAWNYQDDFLAGYDHGKKAGVISVADHNIVPGKKMWTWGNGARGHMWDKILTDSDGPYVELMVGAYSDNQPDYSWLQPYDVKSFDIKWYPFRDIAGVKNATSEAAVNLDVKDGSAKVGFYTTAAHTAAKISVRAGSQSLLEETAAISPAKPWTKEIKVPEGVDPHDVRASISVAGKELVAYSPIRLEKQPAPKPVEPYAAPAALKTSEELYLAGLRIEQFHDPGLDPEPYWDEALRRDPGDIRVNTAMGIKAYRQARYTDAEKHLRKAIDRLTEKYTTPKDAEPFYYLGMTLKAAGQLDEAYKHLFKSTWDLSWRAPAYFSLAEIASTHGNTASALDLVSQSLEHNGRNTRALNLKAGLLRNLGRPKDALAALAQAHEADPLDVHTMAERWLLSHTPADLKVLTTNLNAHPATAAETAAEYMNAGLWKDGTQVLLTASGNAMTYYYLGYFATKTGQQARAAEYYALAAKASSEYVFPFQNEAIPVLRAAMQANPKDARAPYYLGNALFDWQPDQAVGLWEASAAIDPSFAIVHRNLAIARSHQKSGNSLPQAIASLEKAVSLDRKYPLHFFELDQLYQATGVAPEKRLAKLEQQHAIVARRDDALNREIALLVVAGRYDDAIRLLTGRRFAVWEGGTLDVADQWVDAHILRGRKHLEARRWQQALTDFKTASTPPENLPSERLIGGARDAELSYWQAAALAGLGQSAEAKALWEQATNSGARTGGGSRRGFGGGLSPMTAQRYYQALAMEKLGQTDKASATYQDLVAQAEQALNSPDPKPDPGASFEAQQQYRTRMATAHFIAGLGRLGQKETQKARQAFDRSLEFSPDHLGARTVSPRGIS